MRKIGRIRIAMAQKLEAELRHREKLPLLTVYPEDLWIQEGACKSKTWDCALWGADVHHAGHFFKVYSWDRMTDCVRNGFEILTPTIGEHWEREVSRLG